VKEERPAGGPRKGERKDKSGCDEVLIGRGCHTPTPVDVGSRLLMGGNDGGHEILTGDRKNG
jgi:hypothetical protein